MDSRELAAREAIRDVIARYAHCADGGRFGDLVALFTEDGVLEIDGRPPLRGRAAIESFLAGTKAELAAGASRPFIRHHVSSVRIELLGPAEAKASCYFLVLTERGVDHWGRYRDRLIEVGGRWQLRHRRVSVEGRAPGSWAATHEGEGAKK